MSNIDDIRQEITFVLQQEGILRQDVKAVSALLKKPIRGNNVFINSLRKDGDYYTRYKLSTETPVWENSIFITVPNSYGTNIVALEVNFVHF